MSFFSNYTVNTDDEHIKDYTGDGGKYINQSGIYEVILKAVIADATANGSEFLNLWFEYQGQNQPIFQAIRLTNNDGTPNFGQDLFTKLCIICGATQGDKITEPVSRQVPIGKGGEEKECMVLEIFDNLPVLMRVQMEYGMYEGKVQERKNVRNFFRLEDKATASEIVNNVDHGKQYALEEAKYAGETTYNDSLTPEAVAEWKKNRKSGAKDDSKKPAGGFGGKRFGKK